MNIEQIEQHVCRRLREEREKLSLSQLALSYESEVSQNMITYIETGKRTPLLKTILKLCDAMKINPATFFPKGDDITKTDAKEPIIELVNKYM